MSLVSKGSCILNLTLGYDLTKSQKYHSFQEWGKRKMPPKSSDFKKHHLSSSLIPTELMLFHLLKHTIQKRHCGNEGWTFKERVEMFLSRSV